MSQSFQFFSIGGFSLRLEMSAVIGWVVVVMVGANLYMFLYRTDYEAALRFGIIYWVIYMGGLLFHYFGHILASYWVGFPMSGLEFWWMFGRSIYPDNESQLTARQHIIRAAGGPVFSVVWVAVLFLALSQQSSGNVFSVFMLQLSFVTALLLLVGTLLPLSFSDGGTILYYLRRGNTPEPEV